MKTYNNTPYYDDFDESKNFHQIMFKPGYAVQARELTQLQTILRGQIEKFGNHIFNHGSVVIPGNAFTDLSVPYIKIQPTYNNSYINPSSFEGKIVVGLSTGIKAIIKKAVAATETDPITFYLSYITGGGTTTSNTFLANEEIYVESATTTRATIASSNHTGFGSLAFINSGVFYIRGSFVYVSAQSTVMSRYTTTPSVHVLLQISETLVTEVDDTTLLDPAQGSYNYAAPGADRVKISLTLTTLDLGANITDDYVELMRYDAGELKENNNYPSYSELEKSLARRTYDQSGNYLVNGFAHTIREHLKTSYNNGVYADGNRNKFVIEVAPGKGYISGLETAVVSKTLLTVDKARTADHIKDKTVTVQNAYGRYIHVSDLKSLPNFSTRQVVSLYNDNDPANGSATKIGEVRVVAIDYLAGDPTSAHAIYKLYIDQLNMTSGYDITNVGGIRFDSAGSMSVLQRYNVPNPSDDYTIGEIIDNGGSTRAATVGYFNRSTGDLYAYRHNPSKAVPAVGDTITGASSGAVGTTRSIESIGVVNNGSIPIFAVPTYSIKSLKNIDSNQYDITYTTWKRLSITTNSSGYGTATVTDGTILSPEVGNLVAVGPSGIVTLDNFSVSGGGTQLVLTGGPTSVTVNILAQVSKEAIQPKIKTLTTHTLSGVSPASSISLDKADIYRIVEITDTDGNDVTDSYLLHNGQTDYYYGLGSLELVKALPGSNLTIVFEYFAHSGSGDFFCVDSYASLGTDYIARASKYASGSLNQTFDLAKCIDFRPTVGSSGSFSSGSPSLVEVPVVNTYNTTSVQYYVSRIDVVYLNKDKTVGVSRGVPQEIPVRPNTPENSIELSIVFVPAYTVTLADVLSRSLKNFRYTMNDIQKLEKRVANVEYYSTLNSLETSLVSYNVVDAATGLNRFKTGYVADNFESPVAICDYFNRDNRCTFFKRNLSAAAEDHLASILLLGSSTGYQLTGNQITVPYTETPLISQTTSTRVTNLNPFMVFSWDGLMTIVPPADVWAETQDLPTIYNTVQQTIHVQIPRATPAPTPPVVPVEPDPPVWEPAVSVEPNQTVDTGTDEWIPPYDPPVDPPYVEPTRTVTAWARDLGLVDISLINTAAWTDVVTFQIPESVYNQTYGTISSDAVDPNFFTNNDWAHTWQWQSEINAINTAFNSAVSSSANVVSTSADSPRYPPDAVINYWQTQADQINWIN